MEELEPEKEEVVDYKKSTPPRPGKPMYYRLRIKS
jgi:hypothetical protein